MAGLALVLPPRTVPVIDAGGVASVPWRAALQNNFDNLQAQINLIAGIQDGSVSVGDATLLNGQAGSYYLSWPNFTDTPTTLSGYGITDAQPLDATLTALAGLDATLGLLEQTAADIFTKRAIGVAAATSIPTRADADARYQPLDGTLTALAGANWALDTLPIGTGPDTVSQVAFAANTFSAKASTGALGAKAITDGSLSALAGTAGTNTFLRGDGTASQELAGQLRANLNAQALPFAYATSPLVLQAGNDVDPSIFFHGFYSLGVIDAGPQLATRMARGTAAAPAAIATGDHYGGLVAAGHNGSGYNGGGRLGWQARSTFSGTNAETRFFVQTTPSASVTPVSRIYVEPDGATVINPQTANTETSANGKLQVYNSADATVSQVCRLVNTFGTANSGVGVSLDPGNNGYGIRDCLLEATNNGSNQITLVVKLANAGASAEVFRLSPVGNLSAAATIRPGTYTVATLPSAGLVAGMRATVSDATAPTYLGALTGGGTVTCGVLYNGTAWVST